MSKGSSICRNSFLLTFSAQRARCIRVDYFELKAEGLKRLPGIFQPSVWQIMRVKESINDHIIIITLQTSQGTAVFTATRTESKG